MIRKLSLAYGVAVADVFKALDDETRRFILDELAVSDGKTLFEICSLLAGKYGVGSTRQAISQHLAVLESAGLVSTERPRSIQVPLLRQRTARCDCPTVAHLRERQTMKITITSVFVDDQHAALAFYTDVLGFRVKHNTPMGEHAWITVVSPDAPDGPELLLEPSDHPAVKPYRDALIEDGIPLAQFHVDDVHAEHQRLTALGVSFTQPPTDLDDEVIAVFDDTCGNLIMIQSEKATAR